MKFPHLGKIQRLAVVGANTLVGKELQEILSENKFPLSRARLFAAELGGEDADPELSPDVLMEKLDDKSLEGMEAAVFCEEDEAVTRRYAEIAMGAGCLVVDTSGAFSAQMDVPLIIAGLNGSQLRDFDGRLIALPGPATTPIALCLKPLHDRFGIERLVIATYQSASGAGTRVYEALSEETIALMNGQSVEPRAMPHPIAFNCLPTVGKASSGGDSTEEERIGRELRRLLDIPDLRVAVTTVQVPTFCGHGAAVNIELQDDYARIEDVRELLDGITGIKVLDRPESSIYPTNLECVGSDYVFVGRVRRDGSVRSGVSLWAVADNLRKGTALNALESLETLYHYRSMS